MGIYKHDKPGIALIRPKLNLEPYSLFAPPPLGLLILGTILEKNGYNVKILDGSRTELFENGKLIKGIVECDVLGVGIISPAAPRGYMIAEQAKKQNPKIKIVLGGPHATLMPEEAINHADAVVKGEAEEVIIDVVENLEGIVQGKWIEDLDRLPIPNLNLIEGYEKKMWKDRIIGRVVPASFSRGCPKGCEFCSVGEISGTRIRSMTPERMFAEVKQRREEGYNIIFIVDDNYSTPIIKPTRIKFHELMKKLNKTMYMAVQDESVLWKKNRGEKIIDNEYLDSMGDAGITRAMIGIETINPEARRKMGKSGDMGDIETCVRKLHEKGIKVHGFCIVGFPDDTPASIHAMSEYCKRLGLETVQFSTLSHFPGTKLREKSKDKLRNIGWECSDGLQVDFYPEKMTGEELFKSMKEAWRNFYSWPRTFGYLAQGRFRDAVVNIGGRIIANQINKLDYVE